MPVVNLPARVRLALYLGSAVALLLVSYAVTKDWAGDAEVALVTGLAALVNMLAAGKTTPDDTPDEDGRHARL